MPLTLERLVYVSTGTPYALSLIGIAELLGQAKVNNDRRDITGALALSGIHFLQVLEGRQHELESLLARLSTDARHSGMAILGRRTIEARIFDGWSMKGPLISEAVTRLIADARAMRVTAEEAAASLFLV